jgi:hypothetical protein
MFYALFTEMLPGIGAELAQSVDVMPIAPEATIQSGNPFTRVLSYQTSENNLF